MAMEGLMAPGDPAPQFEFQFTSDSHCLLRDFFESQAVVHSCEGEEKIKVYGLGDKIEAIT